MTTSGQAAAGERADLLAALAKSRYFLRYTVRGLTDEQAAQRTTASELCLGGLIKHRHADRAAVDGLHRRRPVSDGRRR
jgi:hypothetical protein